MEPQAATVAINSTPFWIGGAAILIVAVMTIMANRAVTRGHGLMIAVAAAVVLVPYVSNFEWSDKSIKFTTRVESAELAQNLALAAKEEVKLRERITELAHGLKSATDRIAALEASTGSAPSAPNGALTGSTLEEWIEKNELGKEDAINRWGAIQGLEQQLVRPAL